MQEGSGDAWLSRLKPKFFLDLSASAGRAGDFALGAGPVFFVDLVAKRTWILSSDHSRRASKPSVRLLGGYYRLRSMRLFQETFGSSVLCAQKHVMANCTA